MSIEITDLLGDDSSSDDEKSIAESVVEVYSLVMGYLGHMLKDVDPAMYRQSKYLRELGFKNG